MSTLDLLWRQSFSKCTLSVKKSSSKQIYWVDKSFVVDKIQWWTLRDLPEYKTAVLKFQEVCRLINRVENFQVYSEAFKTSDNGLSLKMLT